MSPVGYLRRYWAPPDMSDSAPKPDLGRAMSAFSAWMSALPNQRMLAGQIKFDRS